MTDEHTSVVEHGGRLTLITAGILVATLMQTLDISIVNVALPIIQGSLGATIDEGAWVVTGYIISAVIVIPLTPWLQIRFGRRQYYTTAIIGFTIASFFCGLSESINSLIFWRIVQGAFGGGLIATGQAALRDTFPPEKLGASQGIFALGAIVGPTIGPTLGGWLTDNFSWNYCFLINVVPGIIAGLIILTMMRNPTKPRRVPLDGIGLGLLALGLGSLQYILDEGQRKDWFSDASIDFFAVLSAICMVTFVCWELYFAKDPIVDLRALRYRSLWAGCVLGLVMGGSLYGAIVFLPQYVESILNFTATLAGMLIFCRALLTAAFVTMIVRVVGSGKIDTRALLAVGFIVLAVSNFWLAHVTTSNSPFWTLAFPVMFSGFGLSLLWIPLSIAILGSVPAQVAPKATAFTNLSLQLGGSVSTAVLVTFLAHREAFHQTVLAGGANLANAAVRNIVQHGQLVHLYQLILQQANTMAYADASFILGVLTLCCTPLVFVMQKARRAHAAPVSVGE
jgi:DHA2 family multidrug resistance protein